MKMQLIYVKLSYLMRSLAKIMYGFIRAFPGGVPMVFLNLFFLGGFAQA